MKTFIKGAENVVKSSKNVAKDIEDFASNTLRATLRDIDVRLNQPRNATETR